MGERTEISWTDHTFNGWIGCQAVSPGCLNCYAESMARRYGKALWGPGQTRVRTSPAYWKKPLAWNRAAQQQGERRLVFCASLADVFDNQAPEGAREDLWNLIQATPNLDWQLLTKRPQNFAKYLPQGWPEGYPNVWLGVSAENQEEYDRRWPILAATPARVQFISYEPALDSLTLMQHNQKPDWLIWGGESGPRHRPIEPNWARSITKECLDQGIPVFGKQWGDYSKSPLVTEQGYTQAQAKVLDPNGKGGALLDGKLYRDIPNPRGPGK